MVVRYCYRLAGGLLDKYGTDSLRIIRLGFYLHLEEQGMCDGHDCRGESVIRLYGAGQNRLHEP